MEVLITTNFVLILQNGVDIEPLAISVYVCTQHWKFA